MKRKILMVAYTNYSTDARVIKEAEAAVKNGFWVDFVSLKKAGEENNINGIQVHHVNQARYRGKSNIRYLLSYLEFFFKCFAKVTFLFFKNKYCAIHINNMPDFLVFSALIPKIFGAKIILDIHDSMPSLFLTKFNSNSKSFKYKLLLFQEQISSKFAHSVITVHAPIKNEILAKDGISQDKITIVANFADDSLFKLGDNYSLSTPIKFIFHGTIAERMGFDEILSAILQIENRQNFYLKIIGEGDFSSQLQQLINKFQLNSIVDFENKFYSYYLLPQIIKSYHVGLATYKLSPATNYMLPVKMLEYISLGIPFITVPNRAISHYLSKDEVFFYNPSKSGSLGALINNLIKNPEIILEKRKKIISIRKRFLWSNEEKRYINKLILLTN